MGFFNTLANLLRPPRPAHRYYLFPVRCNRCGETIEGRVDLYNDLSVECEGSRGETTFRCRKVLLGPGACFQPIEVILTFDASRSLKERRVKGGAFTEPVT
ncbi:MAG: hypothetical protein FJZ96_08235 [Chloroflexi bacterium]|nr:hypothetical protein [Chloroflexota bacterium]